MKTHVLSTAFAATLGCAAVLCASPAIAQPRNDRVCLRQIDMYSFNAVPGNRSLIVEDRRHQRYRINFMGICSNLQYKLGLRFKSFSNSNLSCLSRGDQVIQRDPVTPAPCVIRDIQRQTPEMDRADLMNDAAEGAVMKSLAIVLMLAAAPALADAPYAKCLHQGDITQFEPLKGGKALIVTDAFRKQYRIGFRSTCPELNYHTMVAIKTFAGGLSASSRGDRVLVPKVSGRCFIHTVQPYTPDLMAADKDDRRPPVAAKP